tara:strand:+ start:57 stop:770 length:714 start_codon:yes stop_codon:yes gene_type:complete
MLANKLALSLPTIGKVGAITPPPPPWDPSDESSLLAWYKNKVGVAVNASNEVGEWSDSSGNGNLMVASGDATESPTYNSTTGELSFNAARSQHLQLDTNLQLEIPAEFTIGFKMNATGTNNTILGDNTSSNEYFKITSATNLRIKNNTGQGNIATDTGNLDECDIVLIRDSSGNITMYRDGELQQGNTDLSGDILIDAIGIREPTINSFNGTISEIQIYTETDQALTTNVIDYLSNI